MKLPDEPYKLIRLALSDLEKVENDSLYDVYMGIWHTDMGRGEKCYVCLAGAVMAFSLGVDKGEALCPGTSRFSTDEVRKLIALDEFRVGHVGDAMNGLGFLEDYSGFNRRIPSYHADSKKFKVEMLKLAADIENKIKG